MARGRRAAADARWLRTHRLGGGLGAHGGGGYIARVEIPHPSTTNGWPIRGHAAADGTPEARFSINQNWPNTGADDVAVVTDDVGVIQERTKYSAYGVPTCLASADYDGNGVVNSTDDTKFQADLSATDPLSDFNFDGATDFFDYLDFAAAYSTQLGENNGRGVLSRSAVGNRFGYAGYQWDPAIAGAAVLGGKWHVRHRVLDAERGTWLTRDPLGYHDGEDLYEYVRGNPMVFVDIDGRQVGWACAKAGKIACSLAKCVTLDVTPWTCAAAVRGGIAMPGPATMDALTCLSILPTPPLNIPCPQPYTCVTTRRVRIHDVKSPAYGEIVVSNIWPTNCKRTQTCLSGSASFVQDTGVCMPRTLFVPNVGDMPVDPL
jgi:RHS repeat-associated protein